MSLLLTVSLTNFANVNVPQPLLISMVSMIIHLCFQHENHRSLPVSNEYTLDGLYPNTLYHIWLAAKSRRGEGAATPPIATRTEQYGMAPKA